MKGGDDLELSERRKELSRRVIEAETDREAARALLDLIEHVRNEERATTATAASVKGADGGQ